MKPRRLAADTSSEVRPSRKQRRRRRCAAPVPLLPSFVPNRGCSWYTVRSASAGAGRGSGRRGVVTPPGPEGSNGSVFSRVPGLRSSVQRRRDVQSLEPSGQPPMTTPYLVLARKYRPQRFSDLTGQEHVVRTLVNALKTGRVAHAFLFTGPRGGGKTTSARILARALNGEKGPTPEPCGVCGPCMDIAAGNDIDVQEIDAASNNGVDDVRALREAAKYLPARDRYKIYIVDEVHMLSAAAFNALLKTLEEPPGHIKFLLATRLREIAQAEQVAVSDGALALVARQAQGSMRDALSLLDQLFSAHDPSAGEIGDAEASETLGALDRSVVAGTIGAVLRRDAAAALQGRVAAYEAGADFKRLAEELAAHARNLVLASLPGVRQDLPDHELRALAQEAAGHDPAQLARVFELLQAAQDEVARAATPRHALEVALLRAVHLAPSGGLPELVARVEQLSARLGASAPPASPAPATGGSGSAGPSRAAPAAQTPPSPKAPPWVAKGDFAAAAAEGRERDRKDVPGPGTDRGSPLHAAQGAELPLERRWLLLVESVRAARKAALAAVLEHAVPVSIDPAAVVIGLRKGDGRAGILTDRESLAVLEQAFERVLGARPSVRVVETANAPPPLSGAPDVAPAAGTLAGQKEQARARAQAARLSLGREHPAVRAAVEVLGGEIEDVRDLGEE